MSNYLPEQLQTAYETYQQNPNAARQLVSATAQGRQPPSLQGLAAAAALQAPQMPVAPPQGTVVQHLAAQQGIGGQIPNVFGMAPQGAPAPQDPALAPQMPTQAMADGGLVSFMHGGDIRGFATGTSELLRAQGIPDSPGYFESGDINDIQKAFEAEQDLRTALAEKQLKQAVQGASGYSTEMPEALVSQAKTPNAYQLRGKGYIPETPSSLSGLTPEQLVAENARLNKAIKWQNLAQHSAVPEVPPELSMMEKLAASSATKVDPRMAKLSKAAKSITSAAPKNSGMSSILYKAGPLTETLLNKVVGPVAWVHQAQEVGDIIADPKNREQFSQDWSQQMPTWMPGAESESERNIRKLKGLGAEIPEFGTKQYPEEEEESEEGVDEPILREPGTGTKIIPRAKPIKEATKGVKVKTPVEQHIETKNNAAGADTVLENPTARKAAETQGMISGSTPEDTISYLQELAGGPRKLSPAMMQKLEEKVTGAKEDKWLGALMGLVGGTLSSSSPYFGQAVGEGGLKGLSAYQQGAKEQGGAEQALLSAQLGQEDAGRAAQQAAFEHYMKQEQAKMAAQNELAKAKLSSGTKWDLLQQQLAFKEAHPEIYSKAYQPGIVEQKALSDMKSKAQNDIDNEIKLIQAHGEVLSPARIAEITEKHMRENLGPYYSQVSGGLGGAGYSGYDTKKISRIVQ